MTRVDLEVERLAQEIVKRSGRYAFAHSHAAAVAVVRRMLNDLLSLLREGGEEEGFGQTNGEAQCGVGQQADLTDQGGEP